MIQRLDSRLKEIKYFIMPGAPHFESVDLEMYNQAYLYWRDFWNKVFKDNGTRDVVCADTFTRQEIVTFLMYGSDIIGMHLYSLFDLRQCASLEHTYMTSSFNDQFIDLLRHCGIHKAVSLEYLTVDNAWRKRDIGISLGSIILGLAINVVKMLNGDVAIGPTRSDIKVTDLVREFGGEPLISGVMLHNTPCDLSTIFVNKATDHPDPVINEFINYLWKNRVHIGSGVFDSKIAKAA